MRLSLFVSIAVVVAVREASLAASTLSVLGLAGVVVVLGGVTLCVCGLELLAAVLVATYIVALLVLFVVVVG